MADAKTGQKWPHMEIIEDNKVVVTELPQKVQDKIAKFASLTDVDSQEAMDATIYGAVDDFLEDKAKKEKATKNKEKVAEHKKKKAGIDVSSATTALSPEELAKKEKEASDAAAAAKPRTVFDTIYGRK